MITFSEFKNKLESKLEVLKSFVTIDKNKLNLTLYKSYSSKEQAKKDLVSKLFLMGFDLTMYEYPIVEYESSTYIMIDYFILDNLKGFLLVFEIADDDSDFIDFESIEPSREDREFESIKKRLVSYLRTCSAYDICTCDTKTLVTIENITQQKFDEYGKVTSEKPYKEFDNLKEEAIRIDLNTVKTFITSRLRWTLSKTPEFLKTLIYYPWDLKNIYYFVSCDEGYRISLYCENLNTTTQELEEVKDSEKSDKTKRDLSEEQLKELGAVSYTQVDYGSSTETDIYLETILLIRQQSDDKTNTVEVDATSTYLKQIIKTKNTKHKKSREDESIISYDEFCNLLVNIHEDQLKKKFQEYKIEFSLIENGKLKTIKSKQAQIFLETALQTGLAAKETKTEI